MREELIRIPTAEGFELEGRLLRGGGEGGAVVCHPLPKYGGTMDSPVVVTAQRVLAELGLSVLRFNFRGVGGSGGRSESGAAEVADLEAAASSLRGRSSEAASLHLVGYSYGAWIVGAAVGAGLRADSVTLISPPVDFIDHSDVVLPPTPTLVVSGDLDQFGAVDSVDEWLASQRQAAERAQRVVLEGVDHFYTRGEAGLSRTLMTFHRGLS